MPLTNRSLAHVWIGAVNTKKPHQFLFVLRNVAPSVKLLRCSSLFKSTLITEIACW